MKKEIAFQDDQGVQTWRVYYPAVSWRVPVISQVLKAFRFLSAYRCGLQSAFRHEGRPSLVHVHVLTRLGLIALALQCRYAIPYVVTEHWSRYLSSVNTFRGPFRKFCTRLVIRRAAALTTPTMDLQQAMANFGLKNPNSFLLPNLADTERFVPCDPEPDLGKGITEFIHVSCFEDKSKNISGLLHAIATLGRKRTDFRCRFVGTGEDFDRLVRQAGSMGIKDHLVRFSGLLEGEDLVRAICSARFLVISSHYENLPVVISEAFACGIPVLSTDVGGVSEIVNDKNGKLVRPRDELALQEGLEYMLDHFRDYDKKEIRAFAESHFSRQAVVFALKGLYATVLQNIPS